MARKPRLHVPGALYHVMLRGNAQQDVFFDLQDRLAFYALLSEGVRRFGYRVHAFCLMTNHVHLALQMGEQPLSGALQNLSFRYTGHINRTQRRVGHVFQGRYQALLVDADRYGLQLVRYIHLNPVRARMVADPVDYPYSGHRGYMGRVAYSFLTTDWVLSQFDDTVALARRRYARFVAEGAGEGYRAEFHGGLAETRVIGEDSFVERILNPSGQGLSPRPPTLERIVEYVCSGMQMSEQELRGADKRRDAVRARALIGWLARSTGSGTLSAVAQRLRRDLSGLSRAVTELEYVSTLDSSERLALRRHRIAITQA